MKTKPKPIHPTLKENQSFNENDYLRETKSSSGHGGIPNKGFPPPGQRRFVKHVSRK